MTNKDAAEVKIVNYTADALDLLIYTKSGRLATGTTLDEIKSWSYEVKMDHLDYMMDTIKSSFEFVDYVFEIKNVSRAFTHQLVRTRTASFQQQSQRTVDARDFTFLNIEDNPLYEIAAVNSLEIYGKLIDKGMPVQDARGILPTAIHTSIFMKANLRTLSQMAELRLCKRTAGEYQEVFKMMVDRVLLIHPWAEPLLKVFCIKYGICAFPRYYKCPIRKYCHDPNEYRYLIEAAWKKTDHIANPIANKDG
ncbi:MAG: FAD-dependent thymidylate synthase, partial [Nanoarchaeota archaeon]|nr:FAD-dependent thymidylate synthase [Nanoarchaeota archaeon]